MSFISPENPAELAQPIAESYTMSEQASEFGQSSYTDKILCDLERVTEDLGYFGKYFVHTNLAYMTPKQWDVRKEMSYVRFSDGLMFEGDFETYSVLQVGRVAGLVGRSAVRSVCLTFNEGKLLPYLDPIPTDELLIVPVLAIDQMIKTDENI